MATAALAVQTTDYSGYNEDVVRLFTIATVFWGVVGFTGCALMRPPCSMGRASSHYRPNFLCR